MKRLPVALFVFLLLAPPMLWAGLPELPGYYVAGERAGSWPQLLRTLGLEEQLASQARVLIFPAGSNVDV
jgi:hypothetical protein